MNPITDLDTILDWSTFSPDLTGYLPPSQSESTLSIKESLQKYTRSLRMDTLPVASLVSKALPFHFVMQLDGGYLSIPLPPYEVDSRNLRGQGVLEVPASRMNVQVREWKQFLDQNATQSLAEMEIQKAVPVPRVFTIQEGGFTRNICTQPDSTTPAHFATMLMILPTHSSSVRVDVQNGTSSTTTTFTLADNLPFSIHFITFYTGLDSVQIRSEGDFCYVTYHLLLVDGEGPLPTLSGISAVVPQLRDTFRDWQVRRQLQARGVAVEQGPNFVLFLLREVYTKLEDLRGEDASLLAQLAPLAKAYHFTLSFVQFKRQDITIHDEEPGYNLWEPEWLAERFGTDPGIEQSTSTKIKFRDLSFMPIGRGQEVLDAVENATDSEDYISQHRKIEELESKNVVEVKDLDLYATYWSFTHTRKATFLMVIPEELDIREQLESGVADESGDDDTPRSMFI